MTTVRQAAKALLSVCDGAIVLDHHGFNKIDSPFAASLCMREHWTDRQQRALHGVLRKYQSQLSGFGIDYSRLEFEETIEEWKVRTSKDREEKIRQREESERLALEKGMILDFKDNMFLLLQTTFNTRHIPKSIPHGRWTGSRWEYPLKDKYGKDNEDRIIDSIRNVLLSDTSTQKVTVTKDATNVIEGHYNAIARLQSQVGVADAIKNGQTPDIPVPLKIKPFDHQKKAFLIACALDASAMLMEQGTGKTLVAIANIGKRFLDGEVTRVLVMAPLSVTYVWVNEFKKHAEFPFVIHVAEGTNEERKELFRKPVVNDAVNVIVVNYDAVIQRSKKTKDSHGNPVKLCSRCGITMDVRNDYYECPSCGNRRGTDKKEMTGGIGDDILSWKPDMVILDESQRVKNRDTKRSEFVHKLGDLVRFKMILTGTPVTQSPLDLWSQYRFLNKRILYGENFWHFRNKYAIMGGYEGKQVIGFRNLDELIAKAHSIAYRVTKKEALDLPEFTDQVMYCELTPSTRKHYNDMRRLMLVELGDVGSVKAHIVLTKLLRLSQITGGFLPVDTGKRTSDGNEVWDVVKIGEEKISVLREFMEDFPQDKKVVIFCRFIPEINAIVKMLEELGITSESLKGDTKNRDELIRRFQEDQNPRALVVQIATGGLGITLTRADTAIFYSNSYSFADYEQARARIHRIGQRNPVTYINILARGTVDEEVMEALQEKKNVADVVVDRIKGGTFL